MAARVFVHPDIPITRYNEQTQEFDRTGETISPGDATRLKEYGEFLLRQSPFEIDLHYLPPNYSTLHFWDASWGNVGRMAWQQDRCPHDPEVEQAENAAKIVGKAENRIVWFVRSIFDQKVLDKIPEFMDYFRYPQVGRTGRDSVFDPHQFFYELSRRVFWRWDYNSQPQWVSWLKGQVPALTFLDNFPDNLDEVTHADWLLFGGYVLQIYEEYNVLPKKPNDWAMKKHQTQEYLSAHSAFLPGLFNTPFAVYL